MQLPHARMERTVILQHFSQKTSVLSVTRVRYVMVRHSLNPMVYAPLDTTVSREQRLTSLRTEEPPVTPALKDITALQEQVNLSFVNILLPNSTTQN